jgi:hypothetical protein
MKPINQYKFLYIKSGSLCVDYIIGAYAIFIVSFYRSHTLTDAESSGQELKH